MAGELGIDTATQTVRDIAAGPVQTMALLIDAAATVAPGQMYEYNATNDNYDDMATAGAACMSYAICAEPAATISADTYVVCIVAGEVRRDAIDSGSLAISDVDAALLKSGIFAKPDITV